jgi:glycosyltransferase involved in cell wall biosynthesis
MCRGLAEAGVEVTLATTDDDGSARLDVPLGVMIERDGYKTIHFRRTTRPYTFSFPAMRWLMRHTANYDVVHVHASFSHLSTIGVWAARWRKSPYIITPHGILNGWGLRSGRVAVKRLSYALIERQNLEKAAAIHATSLQEKLELASLLPAASTRVRVIHLGVPLPSPTSRAADSPHVIEANKRFTFLFLGRLHPVKALDTLLSALATVVQQNKTLHLLIAGDGEPDYVRWLDEEIVRLDIQAQVRRLVFLSGQAKEELLEACDALVLPSHSESFGLAVVEALVHGKPVIVSTGVALHREIQEAGVGIVVQPNNPAELADALILMAANHEQRESMAAKATLFAAQRFSLKTATASLLALYQEVLQS